MVAPIDKTLRRLLYISTARATLGPSEQEEILRTSRHRNANCGITGLLVTGGRRFLQVLEGETDAVTATFARIKADPRHFAIVVLADDEVSARAFPNWAMGHQHGSAHTGADGTITDLIAPISDPTLRAYFTGFAKVHAAA